MRRPRMTIRSWMVLIAIAALVVFGVERTFAMRRFQDRQIQLARLRAQQAYIWARMQIMASPIPA